MVVLYPLWQLLVGDISSSFRNVFVSPILSMNLAFVGHIVDQNYDIHFTHSSCVVQNQMT
jgi:hypothetical protein